MSDESTQKYFSDGLAEEMMIALSKVSQLFASDRNSKFNYKGKSAKVNPVRRPRDLQRLVSIGFGER